MADQLTQLRAALAQVQNELIEAEARLADRLAEINAFEFEFEARVGHLLDELAGLETEIQRYTDQIQILRQKQIFGQAHIPVEQQYRRTWQRPPASAPTPPPQPLEPAAEAEIKRLYRQLARRFHPDLSGDETERARRTEIMAAVNEAYAARSLIELATLAQQPDALAGVEPSGQTQAQLIEAMQVELNRGRRRLTEIETELRNLRYRPSVELSLDVKSARRQGRDLLAELAAELRQKIARRTVERDILKAQFDQLGPESGFIPLNR
jgi:predicted  nucleic acid-binding Zn-ribbon protein